MEEVGEHGREGGREGGTRKTVRWLLGDPPRNERVQEFKSSRVQEFKSSRVQASSREFKRQRESSRERERRERFSTLRSILTCVPLLGV